MAQPFPVIAHHGFLIKIQIDWNDGHISLPYIRHASENATSWDKHYGNCATFTLPVRVTEDEYLDLVNEIKPLVDDVTEGYTFNGPEQHASFTVEAEAAIESIYDTVSVFDFLERSDEPAPPWFPFGDDWNGEKFSEDLELTEIHVEDEFLLDHSSSDIALRQLVAYWMFACDFAVNENALYRLRVNLRETCRKNFENEHASVALPSAAR